MDHRDTVTLKDGTRCLIRTGTAEDAPQMLNEFLTELGKTEFLRWYPDEKWQDVAKEVAFLQSRAEDPRAVGFREVGAVPAASTPARGATTTWC